jgi:hypothetical protein
MNLSVTDISQPNTNEQGQNFFATAHTYSPVKNIKTKFLTAEELSNELGFSETALIEMARINEILARFDNTKKQWLFHPRAAELYCIKEEGKFLNSSSLTEKQNTVRNITNKDRSQSSENNMIKTAPLPDDEIKATETEAKAEPIEINYVELAGQRTEAFCKLNKREKSKLNKKHGELLQEKNTKKTFDYVSHFDLKMGHNRGLRNLNLRNKKTINKKLIKMFGQERISLNTKNEEEAKIKANELILLKCIETDTDLIPLQNKSTLLNKFLKSCAINNKGMSSEKDMFSKLGFWHYVLGDFPVSKINYALLAEVEETMLIQDVDKSTVSSYNTEIRKALTIAYEKSFIQGIPKVNSYQSSEREFVELPFKEKWMPLVKAYSTSIPERKFLKFSWFKGLRKYNCLHAEYEHFIQLENGKCIMRLPSRTNKSGKAIDVAVSAEEMEIVKSMKQFHKKYGIDSKFVFALNNNDDLPDIDTKRWRVALHECNLPSYLVFHHLRHYFATSLMRKGVDLETIRKLGGWTCLESLKRYIHCGVTDKEHEAIERETRVTEKSASKNTVKINNKCGVVNFN